MVERNIIMGKVGGNSGKDTVNYKISLPAKMVKDLGVTAEDKGVFVYFEDGEIHIKKNDKAVEE